jgi:hypothetical protein
MASAALLSLTTAAAFALGAPLWRGVMSPTRFAQAVGGAACGLAVVRAAQTLLGGGHG